MCPVHNNHNRRIVILIQVYRQHLSLKSTGMGDNTFIKRFLDDTLTEMQVESEYIGFNPKTSKRMYRTFRTVKHIYANYNSKTKFTSIPVTYLTLLEERLKNNRRKYKVEHMDITYVPYSIDIKPLSEYKPRDYQEAAIGSLAVMKHYPKLLSLATGQGKTLTSLFIAMGDKGRTMISARKGLLAQWADVILTRTTATEGDILLIESSTHFVELLSSPDDITEAFILVSSSVLATISEGEKYKLPVNPNAIMETLRVKTFIVDELHREYYKWTTILNACHVYNAIALTATLVTESPELKHIYSLMFPNSQRHVAGRDSAYVSYYKLVYKVGFVVRDLMYTNRNMYNHAKWESILLGNPKTKSCMEDYLKMMELVVDGFHIRRIKGKKEKLIIFAATVNMVNMISIHLQEKYPDKTVNPYIAGSLEEVLDNSDIICTTAGKSSTGLDVDGLVTLFNTINIGTEGTNRQLMGRLRYPKPDESDKVAIQLICDDIPKHKLYFNKYKEFFKDIVKVWHTTTYDHAIRKRQVGDHTYIPHDYGNKKK